jgi:hypothetical protein
VNAEDRVGRRALDYLSASLLTQWPMPFAEERLEVATVAELLLKKAG